MKKFFLVLLIAAFSFGMEAQAQKWPGLDKSPLDMAYYKTSRNAPSIIKVIYSRPAKKGREVFGSLEKFGNVWRTGANEATEIHFAKDVKFGGKTVKAGAYQLFSIPKQDKWTIILNSAKDQWGAYSYDKSKDVASMEVPVKKASKTIEHFSIAFAKSDKGANMFLGWDDTFVEVPFEF